MERLKYLRRCWEDQDFQPPSEYTANYKPLLCQPGQNRDRRPELYARLIEPQPDAFNHFYYMRGGDYC